MARPRPQGGKGTPSAGPDPYAQEPSDPTLDPMRDPTPDPTMEDVLASIRRILSDGLEPATDPCEHAHSPQNAGGSHAEDHAGPAENSAEASADDTDDVFVLDASMIIEDSNSAMLEHMNHAHLPPDVHTMSPGHRPEGPPDSQAAHPGPYQPDAPLVGAESANASSQSVGQLVRALQDRRIAVSRTAGITLEDIARDELRPLLKTWLDENLPSMVERLVRTEIERVIGRAVG